jgi:hypothetical protein
MALHRFISWNTVANGIARIVSVFYREPDFIIGEKDNPYIRRWWIIPRNSIKNAYLHNLLRDDDDRALHDHPWRWCSIHLRGAYYEISFADPADIPAGTTIYASYWSMRSDGVEEGYYYGAHYDEVYRRKRYSAGSIRFRPAEFAHRLELDGSAGPCWTLFLTGRWRRTWGFHCRKGWVSWKDFTKPGAEGEIGPGCGENDEPDHADDIDFALKVDDEPYQPFHHSV